jgi:hypothetical protein
MRNDTESTGPTRIRVGGDRHFAGPAAERPPPSFPS